ncbi:hypothetical protein [Neptunicella sp. SCSIO 80796]|uniref:hypothetical protein n=1 Tax=Neptunicella plasticusilytica TaxID=3117012 RepID=UPI003A4E3F1B
MTEVNDSQPEEIEQAYDEAAASQMIKSLADDESADFVPEPEISGAQTEEATEAAKNAAKKQELITQKERETEAASVIYESLGAYEFGICLGVHKRYQLPETDRAMVAGLLAPIVVKYVPDGKDLQEWILGKYKAEGLAIFGLFMLGRSTMSTIKTLKAEDRAIAQANSGDKNQVEEDAAD